jgi:hypothetical protein
MVQAIGTAALEGLFGMSIREFNTGKAFFDPFAGGVDLLRVLI